MNLSKGDFLVFSTMRENLKFMRKNGETRVYFLNHDEGSMLKNHNIFIEHSGPSLKVSEK